MSFGKAGLVEQPTDQFARHPHAARRQVRQTVLVDGEAQADIVAQQFRKADVDILVCVPDTWAFPQLTTISLLQQFPADTPLNITSKDLDLPAFLRKSR